MGLEHRMNIEIVKRNTKEANERLYVSGVDEYYEEIKDQIYERSLNGFNCLSFNFPDSGFPFDLEIRIIDQLVKILLADGFNTTGRKSDEQTGVRYINISWA